MLPIPSISDQIAREDLVLSPITLSLPSCSQFQSNIRNGNAYAQIGINIRYDVTKREKIIREEEDRRRI